MRAMPASRRDLVRLSALAASALALPALADTRPSEPMRLLILGGTGFIGPHQVRYALARGHHVTVFNRGRQQEAWPGPVEELLGDRNGDLKALEGRDWDVCIDNPTTLPVWVRDAARVLKGHIGQYVFISTISAYAANDKPADETAPLGVYKGAGPHGRDDRVVESRPKALRPPEGAERKGGADPIRRVRYHHYPPEPNRGAG
jgi:2'-hydroxyisoflavone reductase